MDESAIVNVIINSGVVAVLFYLFIVRVSDKLDKLIEKIDDMNANIKVLIAYLNSKEGEKK